MSPAETTQQGYKVTLHGDIPFSNCVEVTYETWITCNQKENDFGKVENENKIGWSLSQLSLGERQGTSWTRPQSITGPRSNQEGEMFTVRTIIAKKC